MFSIKFLKTFIYKINSYMTIYFFSKLQDS